MSCSIPLAVPRRGKPYTSLQHKAHHSDTTSAQCWRTLLQRNPHIVATAPAGPPRAWCSCYLQPKHRPAQLSTTQQQQGRSLPKPSDTHTPGSCCCCAASAPASCAPVNDMFTLPLVVGAQLPPPPTARVRACKQPMQYPQAAPEPSTHNTATPSMVTLPSPASSSKPTILRAAQSQQFLPSSCCCCAASASCATADDMSTLPLAVGAQLHPAAVVQAPCAPTVAPAIILSTCTHAQAQAKTCNCVMCWRRAGLGKGVC